MRLSLELDTESIKRLVTEEFRDLTSYPFTAEELRVETQQVQDNRTGDVTSRVVVWVEVPG